MLPAFLATGTAHSERPPSKPFKVCPEIVTAKDTPCRVLGPTASVTNRMIIKKDTRDQEILELKERIKILESENAALKSQVEEPKVDINKPSASRAIRG